MVKSQSSGEVRLAYMAGLVLSLLGTAFFQSSEAAAQTCARTVTANVVAFDQPIMYNRLGAQNINGMIYALRHDVIDKATGLTEQGGGTLAAGNVELRLDKRARPIVLRVAAGDCLTVEFENLLAPTANPFNAPNPNLQIDDQVADRVAGFHPQGLELVGDIGSDSSFVGQNANSMVAPGGSATYRFFAPAEGTFLVVSDGAVLGSEGTGGNIGGGLFGAVNVQPKLANFYRSQVTEEELRLATSGTTATGHPIVDYEATFPLAEPWLTEGKAGLPIINMLSATNELIHSDINAIIAGTESDGSFTPDTYPLESMGLRNPTVPNRLESFREFTVIFHDEAVTAQAFPKWYSDPVLGHTLHSVRDSFMINYGSGGIGSEIISNRLGVGPMHDCLDCAYEEFFLTSSAVGDPAMLVDVPANTGLEACDPNLNNCLAVGPKATMAFYPDDSANVHHSYTGDFVKFRNLHAGPKEQHIFHLHNHQWLFNANDEDSNYIDAQGLGPGSGYTYEISFGGSGNRNKTVGDAIFHCHFYPHFAQGMWELWRNHDVFEAGTKLAVSDGVGGIHTTPFALADGTPAAGARALADGEIVAGVPIPALVPLPGKAMAPIPGLVEIVGKDIDGDGIAESSQANVIERDINPGYPFWIAGYECGGDTVNCEQGQVGQRSTTPPLDMDPAAGGVDGGLPRHVLAGYKAGGTSLDTQNRLDFSKVITKAKPIYYPEDGTDLEKVAMAFHEQRCHDTFLPDGMVANCDTPNDDGKMSRGGFITNGQPAVAGAPFNEPCIDDEGDLFRTGQQGDFFGAIGLSTKGVPEYGADDPRIYKAAVIQTDVVLNKTGYHFPQQRIIVLDEDVAPTLAKVRPPEPFVIRMNTFDCTKFLHTNLVPEVYELDDYQVRTPTDIIGQHIHLPKWDLTAADGSAIGWNYEDGTLSPGAVRERIHAINAWNDLNAPPGTPHLEPEAHPYFGAGPAGTWIGARTTIQRWFADPVVNTRGVDRGLGIIFTHDHYGPSTHQQVGLYATVLTEPAGSTWALNESGEPMGTRQDGGPTSWQAAITPAGNLNDPEPYREFYFEFADFQHAYQPGVFVGVGPDGHTAIPPTANSFRDSINPSVKVEQAQLFPDVFRYDAVCPGGVPRPCPEAISADDPGLLVVNYRAEPVGLRVYDPARLGPDGKPGSQAGGLAGDLSFAFKSDIARVIPELNTALGNTPYPPLTGGLNPGDPFTPMMRAYQGDKIEVKMQAGAHEEEHNASIHGVKWLQAGSGFGDALNSGWRNSQAAGISEQFTFTVPMERDAGAKKNSSGGARNSDHLYTTHTGMDGYWSGVWGLMRGYGEPQSDLATLPNNSNPKPGRIVNKDDFVGVCPAANPGARNRDRVPANLREYTVIAMTVQDLLDDVTEVNFDDNADFAQMHVGQTPAPNKGTLLYNSRSTNVQIVDDLGNVVAQKAGPLHDPTGLVYVNKDDLMPVDPFLSTCGGGKGKNPAPGNNVENPNCPVKLKPGVSLEPLILRAAAGDCIETTLVNRVPDVAPDLASLNTFLGVVPRDRNDPQGMTTFHNNLVKPSSHVGLHAQLVEFDITQHDGTNVGMNGTVQTVAPPVMEKGKLKLSKSITYRWYAGDLASTPTGSGNDVLRTATPIEYGGTNLMPADKMKQGQKGLMGALVIEPAGSTWVEDPGTRASATVTKADGTTFRDFAVVMQKGQSHRYADGSPVENIEGGVAGIAEDSQDMGQMAINFATEPLWFRFGIGPNAPFGLSGFGGIANAHEAYSNSLVGGDPETPVFTAEAGQEVRMRVLMPHGIGRGSTYNVHGHVWQRDPYVCPDSADLGLPGKCLPGEVGSQAIGDNPMAMSLGHQESLNGTTHFEVRLPSAGGTNAVEGDYLIRDQSSFGNLSGLWNIMRVE